MFACLKIRLSFSGWTWAKYNKFSSQLSHSRGQEFGQGAALVEAWSEAKSCIPFIILQSPSIFILTVLLFISIYTIFLDHGSCVFLQIFLWDCEYRFGVVKKNGVFVSLQGPMRVFEWKDRERSWTELGLGWSKNLLHEDSLIELVMARIWAWAKTAVRWCNVALT